MPDQPGIEDNHQEGNRDAHQHVLRRMHSQIIAGECHQRHQKEHGQREPFPLLPLPDPDGAEHGGAVRRHRSFRRLQHF